MYKNQFLLTSKEIDDIFENRKKAISGFNLFCGDELINSFIIKPNIELYLLGELYDWENVDYSNDRILNEIANKNTIEDILTYTNRYSGEFVLIVVIKGSIYLFNDAGGQKEVYI